MLLHAMYFVYTKMMNPFALHFQCVHNVCLLLPECFMSQSIFASKRSYLKAKSSIDEVVRISVVDSIIICLKADFTKYQNLLTNRFKNAFEIILSPDSHIQKTLP